MTLYRYKALTSDSSILCGVESAVSVEKLREHLFSQDLLAQHISRQFQFSLSRQQQSIPPRQMLTWVSSLLSLLKSGITIYEAIGVMLGDQQNRHLHAVLTRVEQAMKNGASFSDALIKHLPAPDNVFIAAIKTGEHAGDLIASLTKYKAYLTRRIELRKKVTQALTYPAFLSITLLVILSLLVGFVLPRFTTLYADFGSDLPWITQWLITGVENIPLLASIVIAVSVPLVITWRMLSRRSDFMIKLARLIEALPLIGQGVLDARGARFADTLATLLDAGMTLPDVFQVLLASETGLAQKARLTQAREAIAHGKPLADAIEHSQLIPPVSYKLVRIGERSGNISSMLTDIASFHHERLEGQLKTIVSLIEPAIILLMGLLVGAVIIAMYLPIFYIVEVVG